MKGWQIVHLASLAAPHKGAIAGGPFGSDLVSKDYTETGVPVVRGGNLPMDRKFSLRDLAFVSEQKADALRLNCASPGDLVFTQRGTLGQVGILPVKSEHSRFLISQSQMKMAVDKSKASTEYLYWYFRLPSIVSYIENHALQSGVPHINLGILKRFEISAPPLHIQHKIAAVLSAYDDLIENNNRRIALLEKMGEELYREWFVRLRFPGHESTKIVKGVPEGWTLKRIGDITNSVMGQSPASEFYNTDGVGLPFNQGVGTYGKRHPKKEVFCDSKGKIAEAGSILISVRAPVGRLNIADCRMMIGRGLAALSHKEGRNIYLWFSLKNFFSKEDVIGNGAIFNAVSKDELLGVGVIVPSDDVLIKFEDIAGRIDRQVEVLSKQQENIVATRDRLLTRLMSGKIDLESLDIAFPPSMQEAA